MPTIRTDVLEIAYEDEGPQDGRPVLLLHGWPDAPEGVLPLAPALHAAGFRTITPWLRGFGPTRFLSGETLRDGSSPAQVQDALDLADGLGLANFDVIGHDWGARTGYNLAAVAPERLGRLVTLSVAHAPYAAFPIPPWPQSRAWWYQFALCADESQDAVAKDRKGFGRIQWETWSPQGWFEEAAFEAAAKSWENPDWPAITCSSYRSRWIEEPLDPRYAEVKAKIKATAKLSTPTLFIHGAEDGTVLAASTEGREECFTGGYRRLVLEGVGHFPIREATDRVAAEAVAHLKGLVGGG